MSYCYLHLKKRNKGMEACDCHTAIKETKLGSKKRCASCAHLGPKKKGEVKQARLDQEIYNEKP